ncbi:MAG: hypothetical protein GY718_10025 [Lentisphaerae bacterium]|nr:hypothetical protein [Lentisphaerota bacterium]
MKQKHFKDHDIVKWETPRGVIHQGEIVATIPEGYECYAIVRDARLKYDATICCTKSGIKWHRTSYVILVQNDRANCKPGLYSPYVPSLELVNKDG